MTLRAKTISLIGVSLALLLMAICALTYSVLASQFNRLEENEIRTSLKTARIISEALDKEFAQQFKELAAHPETYQLATAALTSAPAYLNGLKKETQGLYALIVLDEHGHLVWAKDYDVAGTNPASSALLPLLQHNSTVLTSLSSDEAKSGLLEVENKPLEIASLPIYAPQTAGKPRQRVGNLLAARFWTDAPFKNYMVASDSQISVLPLTASLKQRIGTRDIYVQPCDGEFLHAYTLLSDLNIQNKWALEVKTPCPSFFQSKTMLVVVGAVLVVGGIACCLMAMYPIEKLVLGRVSKLSRDVQAIRDESNLISRVSVDGNDELTSLARNINATFESLEQASTERMRSDALQREMAQTALAAGDCFFVWEDHSDSMHWIGNVDALLGYPENGFPRSASAWHEHIHPEDRPIVLRAYERAFEKQTPLELEIRVLRADGEILYWMHRGKVIADHEEYKLLGACLDITERKQVEASRHRTETRLARIVETAADAILLFDAEGHVTFANEAAVHMFGLPVEELWSLTHNSPRWDNQNVLGEPLEDEETVFSRVKNENKPLYSFEYVMRGADEQIITVSVNASPLPNESGEFTGVVASFTDISERLQLQEKLTHQAFHDALTGLANRALMRNRIEHNLAAAKRSGTQLGLLFIDLDNFKWVNDSLGHEAGDDLLKEVANRLSQSLRQSDTAARFGGDEFVVLLKSVDNPRYSVTVAQRLLDLISQPFQVAGREVFTSPSIGLAFSDKDSDVETMLRHADAAMYEAKRRGKGRYEVFQENLSAAAMQRLDLQSDLRYALQNDEFSVVYQPKFDLRTGEISAAEALLRWNHPKRGAVSPAQFIPLAEETGLIVPIGLFVLQTVCYQAQSWNVERVRRNMKPIKIAVNISARQFHTGLGRGSHSPNSAAIPDANVPELARDIARVLHMSGLPASQLILEITESVLLERTEASLEILRSLRSMGTKLAIDDFGTGYSSLAYLRAFPFDYLKIDREFVTHIESASGPGVIVGSIIALAHALNLFVIAEGAERMEEVETLMKLECDMAQGYYFSKPLPPNELEELILPDLSLLSPMSA